MNPHPDVEDLVADPLEPAVAEHIEECTRCRVLRLMLIDRGSEPEPSIPPRSFGRDLFVLSDALHRRIPDRFVVSPGTPWLRNTPGRPVVRVFDRADNRPVALVIVANPEDGEVAAERLHRLRMVVHPGLEPIHQVMMSAGTLLYTIDPVVGPELAELDDLEGPTPIRLARQLAAALAALHQQALVHGNVQAASIRVGDRGRLVLTEPALLLPRGVAPVDDWRQLGEVLQQRVDSSDRDLTQLAEDLAQGRLEDTAVLGRLLELHDDGAEGRRYQRLKFLGEGGMGEVHRVRDPALDRAVAMKNLKGEYAGSPPHLRRFAVEARLTSQLQHPGIVPIHEVGRLPDGRPYFTMREIEGRDLLDAINEVHAASEQGEWRVGAKGWTFWRLIEALHTASEAVAYAHASEVIHRDLKPQHVRLGSYGEVLVVDWGLARLLQIPDTDLLGPSPGAFTEPGVVMGTPPYMAPELARGQVACHDRTSDVYSLGAILFHILAGQPPPQQAQSTTWSEGWADGHVVEPPDPADHVPADHPPLPEALVALCCQAMQPRQADRPADARQFAKVLRSWLDGTQQRSLALARLPRIDERLAEVQRLRAEASDCRKLALGVLQGVERFDPVEAKVPGWALQDRAADLDREADGVLAAYIEALRAVLELSPGLPEAEQRLYDYYRDRLEGAEARRDTAAVARYERLLARDPRGRHAAWVRGHGALTLVTDPAGARVELFRCVERQRRRVLVPEADLGTTPLREVPLERGSWVLRVEHPDCEPVIYPVCIGRGEHWDGCAPGADAPLPIVLPPKGSLRPGDCYVPAGWFASGGDPFAPDGLPTRRLWVDPVVVRMHPVTHHQYVDFLNALVCDGRGDEAMRHAPRDPGGNGASEGRLLYRIGRDGQFGLDGVVSDGQGWRPDWPVVLVDLAGCWAYAAWWAEITGLPWRLPHDHEWEKAARGVDGRTFPWGDFLDPTFCCMSMSQPGGPSRASVHDYPEDVSPYGIRGLAGNVRDRCANPFREGGVASALQRVPADWIDPEQDTFGMVRGGSWTSVESYCRAVCRIVARPADRNTSVGFRLCSPWPGPGGIVQT